MPAMNALFDGRWRMIYDYELDRAELYDARNDRAEQHNVAGAHPKLVRRFREQLAMRPIERQAALLGRYFRERDERALVAALPRLRHERLLEVALGQLDGKLKSSYLSALRNLRQRPGLSDKLKKKLDGMIKRRKKKRQKG
jgi:hypothetical protein